MKTLTQNGLDLDTLFSLALATAAITTVAFVLMTLAVTAFVLMG